MSNLDGIHASDTNSHVHHSASIPETALSATESRVTDVFSELGVPDYVLEYPYLRKAIAATIENPELIDRITKSLYPCVAEAFGTNPACVERDMRHAIGMMWDRGAADTLKNVFGYKLSSQPTNSEFIALIAEHLQHEPLRS